MSETTIVQVARVQARCVPYRWAWADAQREAIAAHWAERSEARPDLFNGRVLMVADAAVADDTITASFFETDYANLLAWLDWKYPDPTVANGFAMGALQGSDGAFVLGVMGGHTANAGQVYFPAGTPDLSDLREDGTVDLAASVVRELREETGLPDDLYEIADHWVVVRRDGFMAFLRPLVCREPADAVRARILAHVERDRRPELAGIHIVRNAADLEGQRMPAFLPPFLRWALAGGLPDQG